MSVIAITEERYQQLKTYVTRNREAAQGWFLALLEIKESGRWKADAPNWERWCDQHARISASGLRMMIYRERKQLSERNALPSNTNTDCKSHQRKISNLETEFQATTSQMTAKQDKSIPVEMREPQVTDLKAAGVPNSQQSAPEAKEGLAPDAVAKIGQLAKLLERLMRAADFAANTEFRHAVALAEQIRSMVQPEFSFAKAVTGLNSRQKSRGTREEVTEFCTNVGLAAADADWFFDSREGNGWKNGKAPIVDWRATVRSWQKMGYFPSQRHAAETNANHKLTGPEIMLRHSEFKDCEIRLAKIRERYSSVDRPWSIEDKNRFNSIRVRRDELKKLLGIQV